MNYWYSKIKIKPGALKKRWEKRAARAKTPQRTIPIRKVSNRQELKRRIVRNLGLLDAAKNGRDCRIKKAKHCLGVGSIAYHIIPQMRGDATRFVRENVVWACVACNRGEQMNRSLYRQYHVDIFGKERVENLESIARGEAHFSIAALQTILENTRAEVISRGGVQA
ncbi:MAG: hypothetical protein KGJ13_08315 [Patescibacteria group bacterium]|nr:hypothetical protein [Patescibacteria group bacterium]